MNSDNQSSDRDRTLVEILDASKKDVNAPLLKLEPPTGSSSSVPTNAHIPSVTASAVLGESHNMPEETPTCNGRDFSINGDENYPPTYSIASSIA